MKVALFTVLVQALASVRGYNTPMARWGAIPTEGNDIPVQGSPGMPYQSDATVRRLYKTRAKLYTARKLALEPFGISMSPKKFLSQSEEVQQGQCKNAKCVPGAKGYRGDGNTRLSELYSVKVYDY